MEVRSWGPAEERRVHGDRWGSQELGDTGSLSGFGGSLSGGACTGGGGGEAAFVLTACGCAMLRRTAAPTGTEQPGRLERAAAPARTLLCPAPLLLPPQRHLAALRRSCGPGGG